jgi:hypothetical protein
MKLVVANPIPKKFEKQVQRLFREARRIEPKLTKKEFMACLAAFYRQHHELPRSVSRITGPNPKKKCYNKFANLDGVRYSTDFGRKTFADWIHKVDDGIILSDEDGNVYFVPKSTKVNQDGWLVH